MGRLSMRLPWLLAFTALLAMPASAEVRLVSLAPNVTELVYAAGAGHRLVGVSEYSDYPVRRDACRVSATRFVSTRSG